MDNEMIERGAKAIFEMLCPGIHYNNADKLYYEQAMIAAVKSMREPTEKMLENGCYTSTGLTKEDISDAYTAMIDSITNE